MNKNKRIATLMCLSGLLASGAALAQDTNKGAYVGFSAGQTRVNFDTAPLILGGLPVTYDNSSGAWKAFGGYQFNKYFAAELHYVRFGDYNVFVTTAIGPQFTNIQITGWGAALVGTLPLGKDFSLLGRLGETRVRESRGNCNICQAPVSAASDNTWSPTVGIGIKYDFNPNWSARVEAERYTKIGSSSNNTFGASINLYTAGMAYKF